jgi:hypothetical protein
VKNTYMRVLSNLGALMWVGIVASASAKAPTQPGFYVPEILCAEGKFALRLPKTLPELRRVRAIEKEASESPEYVQPGRYVTRRLLTFSGLALGIITFSDDPERYMLTYAKVTSSPWRAGPFHVGQPLADARRHLGKAAQKDVGLVAEYASEGASIKFGHEGNRISSITYSCYAG